FRINDVDRAAAAERAWESIPSIMAEVERVTGRHMPRKTPIIRPQAHDIEWRVNVTQVKNNDSSAVDGTDAVQLSHGEIEGRRQIAEIFELLRAYVPACGKAYIVDIAPQLGIRETRRIMGDYVLT